MHLHHLVYFVFTMLFTCYMKSVIVIILITMVFLIQNARPSFERVSVGSDDSESLCFRKTSCSFSRLCLQRLNSTV